jgi:hypothetical protein
MELAIDLNNLHPKQSEIIETCKRFNVLKCGRRFGKSTLSIELAVQPMLDGKIVGMWQPTYKDLYDIWNEIKHTLQPIIKSKDESVKQLTLITGGVLDMWSLEEPNNGRGRKYHRVIIDECEKAKKFKEAWDFAIMPTLADYGGDAWFLSTPKFGMTYFKKLAEKYKTDPLWNSWVFTTYDNPHIDPKEVDLLKGQMDELTFACEIMAQDVDVVDKPFAYAFDYSRHVKDCEYIEGREVYLSFDFNRDPITCIMAQDVDGKLQVFQEYKLHNSNIYELCERIKLEHKDKLLIVTGDATGRNSTAMVKDSLNYYILIQRLLGLSSGQIKVPVTNPSISDNRVLLNSIFQHNGIIISPKCENLIFDLKYVQVDDNNQLIKDRSSEAAKCDLLDCARYLVNTTRKNYIKQLQ